ncbi:MAG: DegT/DnrJ/EryC1/StrS family aminotransferase [Nitrospirae bacterium]|nr:DegT/DnrJ/EryC1/StrS family aminotransferase [Nitrospirota bacterium]
MNIPVSKPFFDREEEEAVAAVIRSGWVTQGPKVKEFEEKFAEYTGSKYAVAVTSCTAALHASLAVSGIGAGDEVVVPSLSFIASANSVVHCGAAPVLVDIDPKTCNIDPDKIEGAITEKTKAIMPVHQMGLPADMDAIKKIADKYKLIIIEDAACAIGSEYKGRRIGSHGNTACFSFHPRKIITTGEGGMITTDNPDMAARLRRFRHHGMSVSDIERHTADRVIIESYPEKGYNYRMTDMQAAMGISQLKKLPYIIERRRQIAAFYNKKLSDISCINVSEVPEYAFHNYQSYWIELFASAPVTRDALMQRLLEKGIATRRGIMAIHTEECYSNYKVFLPGVERITRNTILLPIYPAMTMKGQEYVIQCIKEALQ